MIVVPDEFSTAVYPSFSVSPLRPELFFTYTLPTSGMDSSEPRPNRHNRRKLARLERDARLLEAKIAKLRRGA